MLILSYLKDEYWVSNHPRFCVNTHRNVHNMDQRKYHPHVHFQRDTIEGNTLLHSDSFLAYCTNMFLAGWHQPSVYTRRHNIEHQVQIVLLLILVPPASSGKDPSLAQLQHWTPSLLENAEADDLNTATKRWAEAVLINTVTPQFHEIRDTYRLWHRFVPSSAWLHNPLWAFQKWSSLWSWFYVVCILCSEMFFFCFCFF